MIKNRFRLNLTVSIFIALFQLSTLNAFSSEVETYLDLGIADYKDENYEEAVSGLEKTLELAPDSREAAFYLAMSYKDMFDFKKAEKYFKLALELDPSRKEIYLHQGEVLNNLDKLDEAVSVLEKAEEAGIRLADTAYLRGTIHLKLKEYNNAIKAFRFSISKNKKFRQKGLYAIGLAYMNKGARKEAKTSFKEAISADPGSDKAIKARQKLKKLDKLKAPRKYSLSVGYTYQIDDNVILKPSGDTSGINISDEADTKHVVTLKGEYASSFSGDYNYRASYNLFKSMHADQTDYDTDAHTLSVTPFYLSNNKELGLPLSYNKILIDDEDYMTMSGVKPYFSFPRGKSGKIVISAGFMNKDFDGEPFSADEDRNASNYGAGARYSHMDEKGKWYLSASFNYENEDAKGDNWDYSSNRLSAFGTYNMSKETSLNIMGDYFAQQYSNTHTTLAAKRKDNIITILLGVNHIYKRIIFKLQYIAMSADSNLSAYEYDRNITGIGAEYLF